MNSERNVCLMAPHCRALAAKQCNPDLCFPYRKLRAIQHTCGIPAMYHGVTVESPEFLKENPRAADIVRRFAEGISTNVKRGIGLYIFSKASRENARGTGTGKTTAVCGIMNAFLAHRVIAQCKTGIPTAEMPALFLNASTFQNTYNEQFRGTEDAQAGASARYYALKEGMNDVPLLVFDDLGIRGVTEAFRSEIYEIIDTRATHNLSTFITSNMPLENLAAVLDERITSRIAGMCTAVRFTGRDHRIGKAGEIVC